MTKEVVHYEAKPSSKKFSFVHQLFEAMSYVEKVLWNTCVIWACLQKQNGLGFTTLLLSPD